MFVANVCSFTKSLFFQASTGSCQARGEHIPVALSSETGGKDAAGF